MFRILFVLQFVLQLTAYGQTSQSTLEAAKAATQSFSKVKNQTSNADLNICVNQGGTEKCRLTVQGASPGIVTIGESGSTATHTINGHMTTTGELKPGSLNKATATPTIADGSVDSMFIAGTNSAYIVNASQTGVATPNATTCFIFTGSVNTSARINELESANEISCVTDPSGFIRLQNVAGGTGSMTIRWSYIQVY